jgi:ribosomal protein S18 acetylase RimI-like enzyme
LNIFQYGGFFTDIKVKQICDESEKIDIDKFMDKFLKLFDDKQNLLFLSFTNIPFTREILRNWITEARQSGVEYYIACEQDGNIIGITTIRFNPIESFEILALVVDNKYRNQGVGSLLLETAIGKAKEKSFKSVEVAVFADNKNMLSLIIKNYFKPVKIEYRKRFDGEDIVYFKKYLK